MTNFYGVIDPKFTNGPGTFHNNIPLLKMGNRIGLYSKSLKVCLLILLIFSIIPPQINGAIPTPTFTATPGGWCNIINFPVTNGEVYSITVTAKNTYIGGLFDYAGVYLGHGIVLDGIEGKPKAGFPIFSGGPVYAVVSDGAGGWFVGGAYKKVAGLSRRGIVHIYPNGALDPSWMPDVAGTVHDILYDGINMYVGGSFDFVGGIDRDCIARIDPLTGVVDPSFNAGVLYKGIRAIDSDGTAIYAVGELNSMKMDLQSGAIDNTFSAPQNLYLYAVKCSGGKIYMGGKFSDAAGFGIKNLIRVDAATGTIDASFRLQPDDGVSFLDTSGGHLYVAGTFNNIGGYHRQGVIRLNEADGTVDPLFNAAVNGSVYTVAAGNGSVLIGGAFTMCGGLNRKNAARVDVATGVVDGTFDPNAANLVYTFADNGVDVFIGGEFNSAGGLNCGNIFRINNLTGDIDKTFNPLTNAEVFALSYSGNSVYAGGKFTIADGKARNRIVKINDTDGSIDTVFSPSFSNPVMALACDENDIYVGGEFYYVNGLIREGVAKINGTDGTLSPIFNTGASNIYALAVTQQSLYFGGWFNLLYGNTFNNIGKSDKEYGVPDTAFNPGTTGYPVRAIWVNGSELFIGGSFTQVSGQARSNIALVDSITGELDGSFKPQATAAVNSIIGNNKGLFYACDAYPIVARYSPSLDYMDTSFNFNANARVNALAFSPSNGAIYAGGQFTTLNGEDITYLAAVDISNPGTPTYTYSATITRTVYQTKTFTPTVTLSNIPTVTISATATISPTITFTSTTTPTATITKTIYVYNTPTITMTWTAGTSVPTPTCTATFYFGSISGSICFPEGIVYCITTTANDTFVGGQFDVVAGDHGRSTVVDRYTGSSIEGNPYIDNGSIYCCVSDNAGGWYIGGSFTSVGSQPRSGLAHILNNGTLDQDFIQTVSGVVGSMFVYEDDLYIGGTFTAVGGLARTNLAKLDLKTGVVDTLFSAVLNGTVKKIVVDSNRMYIIGDFTTASGFTNKYIAKIDQATGTADSAFVADVAGNIYGITTDGSSVYIAGAFESVNGIQRHHIAKLDANTGSLDPVFVTGCENSGDTIYCVAYCDGILYAGGSFTNFGNVLNLANLARMDSTTGEVDPLFLPRIGKGVGQASVDNMIIIGRDLYLLGNFYEVNGFQRGHTAKIDAINGIVSPMYNLTARDSDNIFCIAGDTNRLIYGGDFDLYINPLQRNKILKFESATGKIDKEFKAVVLGQNILSIQTDGDKVFIAGDFYEVNGYSIKGLAKLDAKTGQLDLSFYPNPDKYSNSCCLYNGALYVAGYFTTIGGYSRNYCAKLDPVSGAADPVFAPQPSSNVASIICINDSVYLGGKFTMVNGVIAPYLAKMNCNTSLIDKNFNPDLNGGVNSLLPADDGGVYVAGLFTAVKGIPADSLIKIDAGTGALDPFFISGGIGDFRTLASDDNGGLFLGAFGGFGVSGQPKANLGRIDAQAGGLDTTFLAMPNNAVFALAMDQTRSKIYLGGSFDSISGNRTGPYSEIYLGPHPTHTLVATPAGTFTYTITAIATLTYTPNMTATTTNTPTYALPPPSPTLTQTPGGLYSIVGNIIANATVYAVKASGNDVYFGGSFTLVGPRTGHGVLMDPTTGMAKQGWPEISLGTLTAFVADGFGGWYLGGDFKYVAGQPRNGLAHIYSNGSLDPYFSPSVNGRVKSLVCNSSGVYAGGNFTAINGQPAGFIAKLDPASGQVDANFDAKCGSTVNAMVSDGSSLFICGNFTSVGNKTRSKVAKISLLDGSLDTVFNAAVDYEVYAVAFDGYSLFIGGWLVSVNGKQVENIAKINAVTGATDPLFAVAGIKQVYSLSHDGLNGLYAGCQAGAMVVNGMTRSGIVKLNSITGAVDTKFLASIDYSYDGTVYAVAATDTYVYAGGGFVKANGTTRYRLAKFDAVTGELNADFNPGTFDNVRAMIYSPDGLYVGGDFASAGVFERKGIAKINAMNGILDPNFKPSIGLATQKVTAIECDDKGAAYVGGDFTKVEGITKYALAKFNALDGTLDTSFSTSLNYNQVNALLYSEEGLFVGGTTGIVRLNSETATVDPSFSVVMGSNKGVREIIADGEGLFVGGNFNLNTTSRYGAAKLYSATGAIDASFASPGNYLLVDDIGYDGTGVYLGGYFTNIGANARQNLAKLDASTGAILPFNPGVAGEVYAIASRPGMLFIGGTFLTVGGVPLAGIARLDPDTGAVDQTFVDGSGLGVRALELSPSADKLYIGGFYSTFKNLDSQCFTAINTGATATISQTGTSTPSITETETTTPTPTITLTHTETATFTQTSTITQTETEYLTATITATLPLTSTATLTITSTATPTISITNTATETCTPTQTYTPVAASGNFEVLIYPNPSNGRFNVFIGNVLQGEEVEISLYTMNFRLIRKKTYNSVSNGICEFDASGIANGTFILRAGLRVQGKIINEKTKCISIIK